MTWRDRSESEIDYILFNDELEKLGSRMLEKEQIDFYDHFLRRVTSGKTRRSTGVRKEVWKEKWDIKNADWIKYCREMG